jgi:CRP/FNR family cyclic AMP-dependent transcriptional regulator
MAHLAPPPQSAEDAPLVQWPARAAQLGATPLDAVEGGERLAALWAGTRAGAAFDAAALRRLAGALQFVQVGADRLLIAQDEPGDFMLIVLDGNVDVERGAPRARPTRLIEARPGDVLGEMALLDAGPRFSACRTRTPCRLAVLEADALTRLMHEDPQLALVLLAALARRLSLHLRQTGARLSALLAES